MEIPYEKGLLGHSDADVLLHAIMDALLGAASLGDIGKHFPDTDPAYKGISSIKLLEHVGKLLDDRMYVIENIDATIIAQRPKMRPHIEQMEKNIAEALHIETNQVNVKATTEEGLGFTGSGEGISSKAICAIEKLTNFSSVDVAAPVGGCAGCGGCASKTDVDQVLNRKARRKSKMKILKKLKPEDVGLQEHCGNRYLQKIRKNFWTTITQKRRRITKSM